MKTFSMIHKADQTLHHEMTTFAAQERSNIAELLARIAEFDARGSYRAMGYPSTYEYCLEELHCSEHEALRRIAVARTGREFPAIFAALADSRLNLSAVGVLAKHLTSTNVDDLIEAATHQTKAAIKLMIAQRFPKPDLPTRVEPIVTQPMFSNEQHVRELSCQLGPDRVEETARAKVEPLASQRFALQMTISDRAHDKLRYVQKLLSHQFPSGDIAQLFEMGLDALIAKQEKQKFAATNKPRGSRQRSKPGSRYIPRSVKREVWARDGGQCTFVSKTGRRCSSRKLVEFDHIDEVARGGRASVDRVRLRCRAHNQYTAERTFGAEFMRQKRELAKQAATAAREKASAAEAAERAKAATSERANELDVTYCLRNLGYRAEDVKHAAAHCDGFPEERIDARVRRALAFLRPRRGVHSPSTAGSGANATV